MFEQKFFYHITIQYLGFRFHGWQKQPGLKTVEGMIQNTLRYVFEGEEVKFKVLGAGRTDAMVSAESAAFELFIDKELKNLPNFLECFNQNLPMDIRALAVRPVDEDFNIIHDVVSKTYVYLFAVGAKFHPFCASIMSNFQSDLDIELMQIGAKLYEGMHYFKAFTVRPSEHMQFDRKIDFCELRKNDLYQASFFPEDTYVLEVRGKGFMRQQIRKMMGALVSLGKDELSLDDLKASLQPHSTVAIDYIAPASGLVLHHIQFTKEETS